MQSNFNPNETAALAFSQNSVGTFENVLKEEKKDCQIQVWYLLIGYISRTMHKCDTKKTQIMIQISTTKNENFGFWKEKVQFWVRV